jgi:hypothetical protein
MPTRFLFFILLAVSSHISAQNLSKYVISPAGGTLSTTDLRVSFTVGEAVVGNLGNAAIILNQGFQQMEETATVGITTFLEQTQLLVYPNPTYSTVLVDLTPLTPMSFNWELSDAQGQVVLTPLAPIPASSKTQFTIDFSALPKAIYYLSIRNTSTGTQQTVPIIKQ